MQSPVPQQSLMQRKYQSNGTLAISDPIKIVKINPNAEDPFKNEITDVSWQIVVASRCDNRTEDVYGDANTFGTGLRITAPQNFHVEITEHPELHKAGYMLLGSPIVVRDEQDELIVPLYKFREGDDLELPCRALKMTLRVTEYTHIIVGVGNTGKKPVLVRVKKQPVEEEYEYVPVTKASAKKKNNHMS